jgi:hypothetical protein
VRKRIGRQLVNPGLLLVLLAGIYLASDEHQWSIFYVQWGVAVAVVLGAIEGAFMIPRHGRLADLAERDLAATAVPAGGQRTSASWSEDYNRAFRQVSLGATVMMVLVVVTVFVMATHAGA